jgi:mannose-6-phosphate isomerase-like protein (cupin superfamily)
MQYPVADLLSALTRGFTSEPRPWGRMWGVGSPGHDLHVKYLTVNDGARTSLQRHERKDELLIILGGTGYAQIGANRYGSGCVVRIRPGVTHRVTGPLTFMEVSTYDDGNDTIRLEDDYSRP